MTAMATPPSKQRPRIMTRIAHARQRNELERWRTIRLAIRGGWGMTLRLLALTTLPPGLLVLAGVVARALIWH